GYDVAQLISDLPYEKAWELQHGKAFKDKDDPDIRSNSRRIVYWRNYGLQYLKGKLLSLWFFRDIAPGPRNEVSGGKEARLKNSKRIRIYDVFGFFQASFLKSIRTMPNVATSA